MTFQPITGKLDFKPNKKNFQPKRKTLSQMKKLSAKKT
jgi:hypothetical protein